MSSFIDLGVPEELVSVLAQHDITAPFPIQTATLPDSLAGRDVLGRGRTGSGKTYAFLLPLLARLGTSSGRRQPGRPRALILAPTRELATQIEAAAAPLAQPLGISLTTIFGGVRPGGQIAALRQGVDLVIACPGRLEDHLRSGHLRLDRIEITVLDEADHMADLGFLPGVKRILDATPRNSQRLLFSATLDRGVDVLVKRYLHDPITHSVDSAQSPVSTMTHHVLHVAKETRIPVLVDLTAAPGRTVVFTRTKYGARNLARSLSQKGVPAVELHGNLSQNARTRNLAAFADGAATTLVATDIAARGIHVDDVNLVVHADPPVEHKAYLHRSGRTARAGNDGTVVTLMLDSQVNDVRDLTLKAGIKPTTTKVDAQHPLLGEIAPGERSFAEAPTPSARSARSADGSSSAPKSRRSRGGRNRGRNGSRDRAVETRQSGGQRGDGSRRDRSRGEAAPADTSRGSSRRRGGSGQSGRRTGAAGGRSHSAAQASAAFRSR